MEDLPWELETEFELDTDSGQTLAIKNKGRVNREKIVQDEIRNTRFKATLASVTYGKFETLPACLLVFDFSFSFQVATRSRFVFAKIQAEFSQTKDSAFTKPDPYNPDHDPIVKLFAPREIWGQTKVVQGKKSWALSVPLVASTPAGGQAGVTINGGVEKTVDKDHRMYIEGDTLSDDDHVDGDNVAEWKIYENKAQEDGIPHGLTTAIVLTLPPNNTSVEVQMTVKPSVAFSLNPVRLMHEKHDPLYLDGKTPKGKSPLPEGITDMSDPAIDWAKVVKLKDEHQAILSSID